METLDENYVGTTVVEDIGLDLPVDRFAPGDGPREHLIHAVPVPAEQAGRGRPWWTALFLAYLHRCTTADHIHLVGAEAGSGAVELYSFPVAAAETVAELAKRADAVLAGSPVVSRLVERAVPDGASRSIRVPAGLPSQGALPSGVAGIGLRLMADRVGLCADQALWTPESVERMARRLALMATADLPIARLPMLEPDARARMTIGWNATARDWPETGYLDLLRAQVELRPNEPAVVHAGRTVTFAELESAANRIAARLVALGAGTGERVGLLCPSGADFVVAAIGILKTGAAVVPLDPVNPDPRVAYMVADAAPVAVLTIAALRDRVPEGVVRLVIDGADLEGAPDERVSAPITGDTVSHLIYTSGSTGEPKAVLERHAALVNLVHWTERAYGVRPGDRASWLSPPGFAVQLMEWMPYLALGVSVHVGEATNRNPEQLRDWLIAEGVTHTMLVAALAEQAWSVDWPADAPLRILVTTAERVHTWPPVDTPFRVVMTYGSTEATNVLSCLDSGAGFDFTAGATPPEVRAARPVPVGRPIANMRVYILDPAGEPVPDGVVGTLHVAGAGLAAGYHERPELTAAKFAANRLPEEPGPILYNTGDLARYRPDGAVELLGRFDSQVKIRGFRVELGEVETAVCAVPGVAEAVVTSHEQEAGDVRLVAYVAGAAAVAAEVKPYVAARLPHYMVPSVVVALDRLPRLPNGKVDRQALPDPDESGRGWLTTEFVAPRGPVEEEIARLWSGVLKLERVGARDNFFELGGHSVLAVRMMSAIGAAFGTELRVPDLCEHPTVAELADLVCRMNAKAAR
jgi:amino acid adenylation domain-containing protein